MFNPTISVKFNKRVAVFLKDAIKAYNVKKLEYKNERRIMIEENEKSMDFCRKSMWLRDWIERAQTNSFLYICENNGDIQEPFKTITKNLKIEGVEKWRIGKSYKIPVSELHKLIHNENLKHLFRGIRVYESESHNFYRIPWPSYPRDFKTPSTPKEKRLNPDMGKYRHKAELLGVVKAE